MRFNLFLGGKKRSKRFNCSQVSRNCRHSIFLVGAQFRNSRLKLVLDSLFFQAVKSPIRANLISAKALEINTNCV